MKILTWALDIWKTIPAKGRANLIRMMWISFACSWSMILWAFFTGQVTLHDLMDLFGLHSHDGEANH